jgi:hypothetical protein
MQELGRKLTYVRWPFPAGIFTLIVSVGREIFFGTQKASPWT